MDSSARMKVVMFPWLANGHTSPLIELAKKLSDTQLFEIYMCSTPATLNSFKNRITRRYSSTIHLLHLHLSSDDLPPHSHATSALPLHLHPTLRAALRKAEPDFSAILQNLRPHLLICDVTLPWARDSAARLGIPAISFTIFAGGAGSYFSHSMKFPGTEFPFEAISLSRYEVASMPVVGKDTYDENGKSQDIVLMNTCMVMEGKYVNYACQLTEGLKILPTGALVQDPDDAEKNVEDDKYMKWLGGKGERSSVLVAFGSEYFLKRDEIEEMAYGLEMSNVNFIWVIRAPKGEEFDVDEFLPQGFRERVQERGIVVQTLAPQVKILRHSSTGGFVSHCGWNSILESIEFGVPIIGMPMHLDQPMNAKVVVELGLAVEVARDEDGKLRRDEISELIKEVVVGKKGEVMRKRVEEMRESVRSTSVEELKGVVETLTQICGNKNKDSILT